MTTMEPFQVSSSLSHEDLSGDDRPWGKALGECACIGVRQDIPESDVISESWEGHFRKDMRWINWEYGFTWERAITCSFLFLFVWVFSSGIMRLWKSVLKVENMLFNA